MSFRVPFSNVVWTKKLKKETTNLFCDIKNKTSDCAEAYALLQIFIISRVKTELKSLPFCLHRIFWCQTVDEHQIRLVKHIHLRKKSSWNGPWQIQFTRLFSFFQYVWLVFLPWTLPHHVLPPAIYWPAVVSILVIMSYIVSGSVSWKLKVPNMRKYGERAAEQS